MMHRVQCAGDDPEFDCRCECRCHDRCGVIMRNAKEPCYRWRGHTTPDHRTRFVIVERRSRK